MLRANPARPPRAADSHDRPADERGYGSGHELDDLQDFDELDAMTDYARADQKESDAAPPPPPEPEATDGGKGDEDEPFVIADPVAAFRRDRAAARRRPTKEVEAEKAKADEADVEAGGIIDEDPTGGAFEQSSSLSGTTPAVDAAPPPVDEDDDVPIALADDDDDEPLAVEVPAVEEDPEPTVIAEVAPPPAVDADEPEIEDEPEPIAAAPVAEAPAPPPAAEEPDDDEEDEPELPAVAPKITQIEEVEDDVAPPPPAWSRPATGAGLGGPPSPGEMARDLTWHVCPFCGAKNESAAAPCSQCGRYDSEETRAAVVRQMGPWHARLPGADAGGPGMRFATLQEMVRAGEIRSGTVVKGPATRNLWRFAARTRGLSQMFGLCWNCSRRLQASAPGEPTDDFCIYCGALLDTPSNPDQQLEAVVPVADARSPARQTPPPRPSLPEDQDLHRPLPGAAAANRRALPGPVDLDDDDDSDDGIRDLAPLSDSRGDGLLSQPELASVFNLGYDPDADDDGRPSGRRGRGGRTPWGRYLLGLLVLLALLAAAAWAAWEFGLLDGVFPPPTAPAAPSPAALDV